EAEEAANSDNADEKGDGNDNTDQAEGNSEEDRIAVAEESLNGLKGALLKAKQKLVDLESDAEALTQKHAQEIATIVDHWTGKKGELAAFIKPMKAAQKTALAALKEVHKEQQKVL